MQRSRSDKERTHEPHAHAPDPTHDDVPSRIPPIRRGRRRAHARHLRRDGADVGAGQDGRRRRVRFLRAERVPAHRQGQHRHGDRQAPRDGPGRVHRPADARRRGARRRVVAGARGRRARRCRGLQQPAVGTGAGHGRVHRDREFVRAISPGRRCRARDAGRRRRRAMEGARKLRPGEERRADVRHAQGHVRRARRRRREAAGAHVGHAQGPEGLRLHRQGRAPHRLAREVQRHRALHAGREAARHADGGRAACAALRAEGRQGRLVGGEQHSRRALRGRDTRPASP